MPDLSNLSTEELLALRSKLAVAPQATPENNGGGFINSAKQLGYGVIEGVASIAGLQGDARDLIDRGIDYAADKLGLPAKGARPRPLAPNTAEVLQTIKPVTGDLPAPQTQGEKYARTTGQFAAGLLGPGSLPRRAIGGVLIPAAASETAGQYAPEGYEGAARLGGALAGGLVGSARLPAIGANATADRSLANVATPEAAARLRELGPDAFLFEGNPTLTQMAQGVVQRPGQASEKLRTAVTQRHEGAPARLDQSVRDNFGPPIAPSRADTRAMRAQENLGPDYRAALSDATPANVQPIIRALDTEIARQAGAPRQALQQIRSHFYDGNRLKTSAGEMLSIRQAIDDMVPRFEGQNNASRLIGEFRQSVDDAIREAAPSVKNVDARFENIARQRDALEEGRTVLRTGPEAVRPSELAVRLANLTPTQQAMLRMGTRADIERVLGTSVFDVNALRNALKGDGKWNHQKLAQIFGQSEADAVMAALEREVTFRRGHDQIVANSQTAPRLAAEEATRVKGPGNISPEMIAGGTAGLLTGNPLAAAGTAATVGGARKVWEALAAGGQRRLDQALVDRLGSQGAERDAMIAAMARMRRTTPNATREMLLRSMLAGAGSEVHGR